MNAAPTVQLMLGLTLLVTAAFGCSARHSNSNGAIVTAEFLAKYGQGDYTSADNSEGGILFGKNGDFVTQYFSKATADGAETDCRLVSRGKIREVIKLNQAKIDQWGRAFYTHLLYLAVQSVELNPGMSDAQKAECAHLAKNQPREERLYIGRN